MRHGRLTLIRLRLTCLAVIAAVVLLAPGRARAQPNASFNLANRTETAIQEVYATSSGQTTWGRNRLDGNAIPPGESRPIRLLANGTCIYDIRVVYSGGRADQRRAVNTCTVDTVTFGNNPGGTPRPSASPSAPTPGGNPSFNLINRDSRPVSGLYAAPADQAEWGANRLGEATLETGARFAVRLPADGTCEYKLRVVFKDGQSLLRRRVNLCATTDIPVP